MSKCLFFDNSKTGKVAFDWLKFLPDVFPGAYYFY